MVVAIGALADRRPARAAAADESDVDPERSAGSSAWALDTDLTITEIAKDCPAEKAGLKIGDRLIRFNGQQIGDTIMLGQAIQSAPKDAKLMIHRDGKDVEGRCDVRELIPITSGGAGGRPAGGRGAVRVSTISRPPQPHRKRPGAPRPSRRASGGP
jgi:membrane-associated protease RseP (regulator of RpoE activity)